MSSFVPLIAVGMGEILDVCPSREPEIVSRIEDLLRKFVSGERTFEEVRPEFIELVGTDATLVKIQKILQIDGKPLPPAPEYFLSTKQNQIVPRKKARPWTEQEDMRLLAAIHKYGLDAWGPITNFVGSGRSRSQCSQRWFRGLDPRISKVLWSPEEDQKLIALVAEHGDHCWTKVANELGHRSDAQCRYRYSHLMKDSVAAKVRTNRQVPVGPGVKEVASVPAVMLRKEIVVNPAQSMQTIPMKIQLPPISDLLEQGGLPGDLVMCSSFKL